MYDNAYGYKEFCDAHGVSDVERRYINWIVLDKFRNTFFVAASAAFPFLQKISQVYFSSLGVYAALLHFGIYMLFCFMVVVMKPRMLDLSGDAGELLKKNVPSICASDVKKEIAIIFDNAIYAKYRVRRFLSLLLIVDVLVVFVVVVLGALSFGMEKGGEYGC